ncbi:MAG: hypothetical protein QOJ03_1156 [Frankiaceae bacterium]|jgi:hypothetical protein|nr:hypothetical protein [Frankiaceae bacterium]
MSRTTRLTTAATSTVGRRFLVPVVLAAVTVSTVSLATSSQAVDGEPPSVPHAKCGPGSLPETGLQGRVPPADRASGRAAKGYRCNTTLVGHYGTGGGFKTLRYVDGAGHECAYFDASGVQVLDMTKPTKPVHVLALDSPAMQSPHESLVLNQRRGLLVAVMGNAMAAPGVVDVYNVKKDCRHPELLSSTPVGIAGHESGFSPDGRTFFATAAITKTIVAIDLDDPRNPVPLWFGSEFVHGVSISDDGKRAYLALFPPSVLMPRTTKDGAGPPGIRILDISQIQSRATVPQVTKIADVTWSTVSFPQNSVPVTIQGKKYLVEWDEFSDLVDGGTGAARIIDLSHERTPRVVSDLRLEVNQAKYDDELANDPGADAVLGGYAAHYCAVPSRKNPGIVACSFILSGLRVFDIRDPLHPREVAYDNPPQPGDETSNSVSAPTFVPERREIWYTDGRAGFRVIRLSRAAWPNP